MSRAVKILARTMLGSMLALALMGAFSGRSTAASLVTPGIPNQPVYASGACGGYDDGFQRGLPDGRRDAYNFGGGYAFYYASVGCGREFLVGYQFGYNQGLYDGMVQAGLASAVPSSVVLPMPKVIDVNSGWGAFGSTLGGSSNWSWHDTGDSAPSGGYDSYYGYYDGYDSSAGYYGDGTGSGGYDPYAGYYDGYDSSSGYYDFSDGW